MLADNLHSWHDEEQTQPFVSKTLQPVEKAGTGRDGRSAGPMATRIYAVLAAFGAPDGR
jgi:hypothetical protein